MEKLILKIELKTNYLLITYDDNTNLKLYFQDNIDTFQKEKMALLKEEKTNIQKILNVFNLLIVIISFLTILVNQLNNLKLLKVFLTLFCLVYLYIYSQFTFYLKTYQENLDKLITFLTKYESFKNNSVNNIINLKDYKSHSYKFKNYHKNDYHQKNCLKNSKKNYKENSNRNYNKFYNKKDNNLLNFLDNYYLLIYNQNLTYSTKEIKFTKVEKGKILEFKRK